MQSGNVKKTPWLSVLFILLIFTMILSCFVAQAAPVTITNDTQFKDTSGNLIHTHGGGMIKVGSTYYWFGECRQNGGYLFDSVKCYSSTDLKNWTFVRNALSRSSAAELNTCNIERPKVMYCPNTGQYVMWMHWENGSDYTEARCAVAYSSTVDGPYTYQGSFRPYQNQGVTDHGKPGYMSRDCTVFVEGNTGYFISAANENVDLHLYQLTTDFRNISTLAAKLYAGSSREAPCLFKRGSYYFLLTSGCTGWAPNQAKYGYSTSLTSGWSGLINIADSTTYNSQGAFVIPVSGSSNTTYLYLGDHWGDSFGARPNDSKYIWLPLSFGSNTSMTMSYNANITIDTATGVVTLGTVAPTPTPVSGPRSAFTQIEAESFNSQSGVQSESCTEGGQNIGYIENGDYVVYNSIDFGTGATSFQVRAASGNSGGNIEIRLDSTSGALVGTCAVAGTGGWQTWVTNTCNVGGASGIHNLYLRFTGGSGYLMNINWFKFTSGYVPTPTPTVNPTPTPVTVTPTPSAPTVPTPTPTPAGSYVRFRNVANGLYIDGMGSTANGSNACQYAGSSSTNQQWTIINSGGYVMIQNRATGLYLDGMGRTSNGSICGQWTGSGSTNQQWTQETVGSYVKFKNRATGLYLDGMGSTSNGSNLCQWGSSSSTNQQWQIQ